MGTYEDLFVRARILSLSRLSLEELCSMDFEMIEKRMLEDLIKYNGKDAEVTHDLYYIKSNVRLHGTITGRFNARSKVA